MAAEIKAYRNDENLTASTDILLIQVLHDLVQSDDYYAVKEIKERLVGLVADVPESPPKWLSTEWTGRALKRLGVMTVRRLGTGRQYRVTPEQVQLLLKRVGANLLTPEKPTQDTQVSQESLPASQPPSKPAFATYKRDLGRRLTILKDHRYAVEHVILYTASMKA